MDLLKQSLIRGLSGKWTSSQYLRWPTNSQCSHFLVLWDYYWLPSHEHCRSIKIVLKRILILKHLTHFSWSIHSYLASKTFMRYSCSLCFVCLTACIRLGGLPIWKYIMPSKPSRPMLRKCYAFSVFKISQSEITFQYALKLYRIRYIDKGL